ncbi:MAG: hypothetical protein FWF54_02865 [Candidatus Azobacteroides sp.]|nr:hypothetical protein [Candidatus Azobacteroides sp.]
MPAVVQVHHHYTTIQLNHKLLLSNNGWAKAEHLSHWLGQFMPYKECSPTDFLYDKEVSDTVLKSYNEFRKWIKIAEEWHQ